MKEFRLKALEQFEKKPLPRWGGKVEEIDFQNIYYYLKPAEEQGRTWDEVPADIKKTFDRLGIPEAEQKFLSGVGAQYDSETVYHKIKASLSEKGVIFLDTGTALKEHPELFREYFGTIIPTEDNKFAALNSAVWSGGWFIYVPKGVKVDLPLQAYFRINAKDMGQFERTLIIVDEGASVHYVEGCTAPTYASDSLHSAVVEIIVKRGAYCRYTTIQNWSNNVYNLLTKRAIAYGNARMECVDAKRHVGQARRDRDRKFVQRRDGGLPDGERRRHERERVHRADHEGAAHGIRGRDEPPHSTPNGGVGRLTVRSALWQHQPTENQ